MITITLVNRRSAKDNVPVHAGQMMSESWNGFFEARIRVIFRNLHQEVATGSCIRKLHQGLHLCCERGSAGGYNPSRFRPISS